MIDISAMAVMIEFLQRANYAGNRSLTALVLALKDNYMHISENL